MGKCQCMFIWGQKLRLPIRGMKLVQRQTKINQCAHTHTYTCTHTHTHTHTHTQTYTHPQRCIPRRAIFVSFIRGVWVVSMETRSLSAPLVTDITQSYASLTPS